MTWEMILLLSTCCCAVSHFLLHLNVKKLTMETTALRDSIRIKTQDPDRNIENDLTHRLELLQRARFADVTPRRMRTR